MEGTSVVVNYMGGLEGPPKPPAARQRPGEAVALLEGTSVVTVGSAKIIAIDPATGARTLGVDPRRDAHGIVA